MDSHDKNKEESGFDEDQGPEDLSSYEESAADDFDDYEDEFVEEDWEAYDDEFVDDVPEKPVKKKGKSDKLIIGGGVVIGGLVMIFVMGGGGDNASVSLAPVPQQLEQVVAVQSQNTPNKSQRALIYGDAPPLEGATQKTGDMSGGFLTDPRALQKMQEDIEDVYDNTEIYYEDIEPEEPFVGTENDTEVPEEIKGAPPMPSPIVQEEALFAPQENEEVAIVEPVTPFPDPPQVDEDVKEIDVSEGAMTNNVKEENLTNNVAFPTAKDIVIDKPAQNDEADFMAGEEVQTSSSFDQSAGKELVQKLDMIAYRLNEMGNKIDTVESNMLVEDDLPDISSLKKSLSKLEGRIDALEKKYNSQTKPVSVPEERPSLKQDSVSVRKTTTEVTPELKKSPSLSPPPARSEWVLKGAQPGKALVSLKGESDIRTIVVGDVLEGIGKVESISSVEGVWVVQGTIGKIVQ